MAYTKTDWTPTTPINPSNLNKIEEGIRQNAADIEDLNSNLEITEHSGTTESLGQIKIGLKSGYIPFGIISGTLGTACELLYVNNQYYAMFREWNEQYCSYGSKNVSFKVIWIKS